MFERYNLKTSRNEVEKKLYVNSSSITKYKTSIEKTKTAIRGKIVTDFNIENSIDGTKLSNEWFPLNQWDVFISHSHNDVELALQIATWIENKFKLRVFVDSLVWGSADTLLKEIDDKYCVLHEIQGEKTYRYESRNYSTSHVHMMLFGAICEIINNTECIIFINTPNSLKLDEISKHRTNSPWIYGELKMTSFISRKYPRHYRKELKSLAHTKESFGKITESLIITYDVENQLNSLKELKCDDLLNWAKEYEASGETHQLDCLYFKIMGDINE